MEPENTGSPSPHPQFPAPVSRRKALMLGAAGAALGLNTLSARGQARREVKLAVLTDFSSAYSVNQGYGIVSGIELAIEDFQRQFPDNGLKIELVHADHQNKPDVGANIARKWFDSGVDAIFDLGNSSIGLAVVDIAAKANKAALLSAATTARLTGDACTPVTVHWTQDTWELANVMARAIFQEGGRKWFFITADYSFGHDLEAQASAIVKRLGGTVVGSARHPMGAADYSSLLLQAQSSGADVVAFANAGGDTVASVKQAQEFGITRKQKLAALIAGLVDIHGMGLANAQGLLLSEPFYWNANEATRAWTQRFLKKHPKSYPSLHHAGNYASALHYLKAVAALKGEARDGRAVVAQMKRMRTHDGLFSDGVIRADGRKLHDITLYQVKTPSESRQPWDYYKQVRVIPGDEAFRPLREGNCPLV